MRIQKSTSYGKISVSVGGAGLGFFRRFSRLVLIVLLILPLAPVEAGAVDASQVNTTTVLFTHDLHYHFLPQADGT